MIKKRKDEEIRRDLTDQYRDNIDGLKFKKWGKFK
jgi:hypothetical protein